MDGHDGEHLTRSLYDCAALVAGGARYLGLDLGPGTWAVFRLADPDGTLAEAERAIRRRRAPLVAPQDFIEAISMLRRDLRETKRRAGCWFEREAVG